MQTLKNKTFPLINSIIRLLLKVGVILAIIITSFLVQKQPVYAATNSGDSGAVLLVKSNFSTLEDQVSQSNQPAESLPSASIPQLKIFIPLVVNSEPPLNVGVRTSVPPTPTPTTTQVPPSPTPTATSVPSTPTPTETSSPPTSLPIETGTPPTPTPSATGVPPTSLPTETSVPPTPTPSATGVPSTPTPTAMTYYVSPTGLDANPGTFEQPYKTIQKGVDSLVAGDTLYVRGGTYTEKIDITRSGSPLTPIVISSYPGETAIMDGSGLDPQLPKYTYLVYLFGSYITFENFELTYPNGRGVFIAKDANTGQDSSHNIIRNLNIHHMWGAGIAVWGSNNLIEDNKIWQTVLSNSDPATRGTEGWGAPLFFGDSSHRYYGLNTIIRNNEVYQNYGEGILCMYTDNGLIEGNHAWDNWALGIYPDQCSFTTIKNNLIYYTNDHEFWRYPTSPGAGILISNEGIIKNPSHPIGHDRIIFNNIIINAGGGISFWTGYASGSALVNDTIANNTIVSDNAYSRGINISVPEGANHQNTVIENNLVLVNNGTPGSSASDTGLTFSKNLWSKKPDSSVVGAGDIVADPLLINPNQVIDLDQIANPVNAGWYQLSSSSPAIDQASVFSYVTNDFLGAFRGNHPDIGALEHQR